jgi:hypothetical protein
MLSRKLPALAVAACALAGLLGGIAAGCSDDAEPVRPTIDASYDSTTPVDGGAEGSVVAKGQRVLGLALPIGDVAFAGDVQIARDGGVRATNVTLPWDEIERPYDAGLPDAGDDDAGDGGTTTQIFNASLHVTNLILSENDTQALLAIAAVDASGSRAPVELQARPLDDLELAARYDKLTDYVLKSTPDVKVGALFVGTEVDVALGDDAAKHAAFATFVGRAAAKAHALRPGLKVGFTVTSDGLEARASRLAAAWAASDVVGITFLRIDAAAHVRSPAAVASDLDRILAAAPPGKPIVLHEAGFPTSAACGGDEAAQAAFVSAVFAAWDRHAERMPFVTFRELDDAPDETVAALATRYGRSDPPFLAFLGSLGLRTQNGRRKQASDVLIREARARGF